MFLKYDLIPSFASFVDAALDYYKFILDEEDIEAITNPLINEGKDNDPATKLIMTIREIFWNFSDSSFYFGEKLSETGQKSKEKGLFQLLMVDLEYILKDTVEALEVGCTKHSQVRIRNIVISSVYEWERVTTS